MSDVDRELLRRPFDHLRERIVEAGGQPIRPWVHQADQLRSAVRMDLASVGIDAADDELVAAAIGGFAIGAKVCLTMGIYNPQFYAQWLAIAEAAFGVLETDSVDLAGAVGTVPPDLFEGLNVDAREDEEVAPERPADHPAGGTPVCVGCGGAGMLVLAGTGWVCPGCAVVRIQSAGAAAFRRLPLGGPSEAEKTAEKTPEECELQLANREPAPDLTPPEQGVRRIPLARPPGRFSRVLRAVLDAWDAE